MVRIGIAPLLVALGVLPVIARGAEPVLCPWLNAATAGGVLGGAITNVTVKPGKTADDASCEFARTGGSPRELRIEVETMPSPAHDIAAYKARCRSAAVPLKAIGNEAVACTDETGALVVGRVRDRAFIVRISSPDHSGASADLRDKTRAIAEQVAGILF